MGNSKKDPNRFVRFGGVKKAEAREIEQRRKVAVPEAVEASVSEPARVGLALSGGGIRSAIFSLGLLQAFSHRGLLRFIDYVSSVSGGGYIAGYLASQEPKSPDGEPENFHASKELAPLGVDPQTGQHKVTE